jgi:hypothetical protein
MRESGLEQTNVPPILSVAHIPGLQPAARCGAWCVNWPHYHNSYQCFVAACSGKGRKLPEARTASTLYTSIENVYMSMWP